MWCLDAGDCFPGVPSLSSDDLHAESLKATCALEAICLLGLVAACVSAVVTNCCLTTPRPCLSVVDVEFVAAFSGILGFVGAILFLVMMKPFTSKSNGPVFNASFYLATIISFTVIIVAVIIAVGNRGSSRTPLDSRNVDRGVTVNLFPMIVLGGDTGQARGQGNDSVMIQGDHSSEGLPPLSAEVPAIWTIANSYGGNSSGTQGDTASVFRRGDPSGVQGDNHSFSFPTEIHDGGDRHIREDNSTLEGGNVSVQGDSSVIQEGSACDSSVQGGNPARVAFWPELSALSPDRVLPTAPPLDFD